jgi:hypothetical protein
MRSDIHCPKLQRLHDPSIRRDYVVMTDHPACYDFVKEATAGARAAMRSTKWCATPPKQNDQIVCLRCGGTLYAREGDFFIGTFPQCGAGAQCANDTSAPDFVKWRVKLKHRDLIINLKNGVRALELPRKSPGMARHLLWREGPLALLRVAPRSQGTVPMDFMERFYIVAAAVSFFARCRNGRGKMNCGRLWLNFLRDIRPLSEELPLAVRIAVHWTAAQVQAAELLTGSQSLSTDVLILLEHVRCREVMRELVGPPGQHNVRSDSHLSWRWLWLAPGSVR